MHVQPEYHSEEATRIEQALDEARSRVEALASRAAAQEARWLQAGAPWDRDVVRRARFAALHLGHVFMAGCEAVLRGHACCGVSASHRSRESIAWQDHLHRLQDICAA